MKYMTDKNLIRATRLAHNLSQQEAADLIGVSFSSWQKYEYGIHKMNEFYWEKFISLLTGENNENS